MNAETCDEEWMDRGRNFQILLALDLKALFPVTMRVWAEREQKANWMNCLLDLFICCGLLLVYDIVDLKRLF